MTDAAPPSRYGLSSTMRGIYIIRWLLFAGGLSIAFALLERAWTHTGAPLLGLAVGFVAGLLAFRGQARAALGPALLLTQVAVYLVQRRRAVILPWTAIEGASVDHGRVMLRLREVMAGPDGAPTQAVALKAQRFGAATAELASALDSLARTPALRERLAPDEKIKAHLAAS